MGPHGSLILIQPNPEGFYLTGGEGGDAHRGFVTVQAVEVLAAVGVLADFIHRRVYFKLCFRKSITYWWYSSTCWGW